MCLYKVKDNIPKNIKYAYKVFSYKNNKLKLKSLYYYYYFKLNEWHYDISDNKIEADDGKFYETGFHCFTNKKNAIFYKNNIFPKYGYQLKLYKVEVKNIVAFGKQYDQNTIVCKQIKILEEIK